MTQPPPPPGPPSTPSPFGGPEPTDGPGHEGAPVSASGPSSTDGQMPFSPQYGAGQSFQATPPGAAQPPKRRWPLWTALGCGLLALVVLFGIAGCAAIFALRDGDDADTAPTTTSAPEESSSPAEEQPTEEATEEEPAEEETTGGDPAASDGGGEDPAGDDAAAGAPGTTWENPAPAGSSVMVPTEGGGTFEVSLGTPDWAADQVILEENSLNDPPPEGQVYVLIPATATYTGEGPEDYWITVSAAYVDSTGTEHRQSSAVPPRMAIDLPEFTEGSTGEFDMVFLLPEDEVGKGSIAIGSAAIFADEWVYVLAE